MSKIIEIKNLSKKANIKKIDLGVKGFVIAFRENFKNYEKVINVVKNNSTNFKFRKDNKLSFKDSLIALDFSIETVDTLSTALEKSDFDTINLFKFSFGITLW